MKKRDDTVKNCDKLSLKKKVPLEPAPAIPQERRSDASTKVGLLENRKVGHLVLPMCLYAKEIIFSFQNPIIDDLFWLVERSLTVKSPLL